MKVSFSLIAAGLASLVAAKPVLTNSDFTITEGQPFEITWSNAVGPVELTVVAGDPDNLLPVKTITTSGSGGSFVWTPSDLPSGEYAIRIKDSTPEPNFSIMFTYSGTGTISSSSITSRATSTTMMTSTTTSSAISSDPTSSQTSSTRTSSSTTAPTSTNRPANTNGNPNAGQKNQSPLAFVLVSIAAFIYFN